MAKQDTSKEQEKEGKEGKLENSLRKIRSRLLLSYIVLITIAIVIVSFITLNDTEKVMERKTESLLSALNMQMKLSIDNYLEALEENAVMAFAQADNYEYDPTQSEDEYEKIQTLKKISDNLLGISLMENYNDFGIVYRNGDTAGRFSSRTGDLYQDQLFAQMETLISEDKQQEGWCTGYNGDYKSLYFAKKLNENAILICSVYASELSRVFEYSKDTEQITVRIIDNDYNIIYSSQDGESGQKLPEKMAQSIGKEKSASVVDGEYMHHVNPCGIWRVLSSISEESMKQEYEGVRMQTLILGIVTSIICIIAGILLSRSVTNPLNHVVDGLNEKAEFDQLTGVYNKMTFERHAEERMEQNTDEYLVAYLLSDIDDFKKVNDVYGHSIGDRVLRKYGKIIASVFHKDIPGRIGGDEFAALIFIPKDENRNVYVGERIGKIQRQVRESKEGADFHVSIGVAFQDDSSITLRDLYRHADEALYETKRRGKNGYTFYSPDKMKKEGEQQ